MFLRFMREQSELQKRVNFETGVVPFNRVYCFENHKVFNIKYSHYGFILQNVF